MEVSLWLAVNALSAYKIISFTVSIQILNMTQFNIRNSIPEIYPESNPTCKPES